MTEPARTPVTESLRWLRWRRLALIGAIASVGLERIDLLGGMASFRLTPFLVIAPIAVLLVCLTGGLRVLLESRDRFARIGLVLVVGFLTVAALSSVLSGFSLTSVRRVALLFVLALGAWACVQAAVRLRDPGILRTGALVGLALFAGFDVVQLISHTAGYTGTLGSGGLIDVGSQPFSDSLIRLSGGVLDPNRAAMLVAVYTYILLADPWTLEVRRRRAVFAIVTVAALLVLGTLSRSGSIVFFFVLLAAVRAAYPALTWKSIWICAGGAIITVGAAVMLVIGLAPNSTLGSIVSARFNLLTDGSALSHFGLYAQGIAIIKDSPERIITGVGYGDTYLYLTDVLAPSYFGSAHSGNYYAMFHSSYLTALVELGIVGLIVYLALCIGPMFSSRAMLAIGLAGFGVFYQALSDPIYWVALAMLWCAPRANPLLFEKRDGGPLRQASQPEASRCGGAGRFVRI